MIIVPTNPCDGTSAWGPMSAPIGQPVLVGIMLVSLGFGTSSALAYPALTRPVLGIQANTTVGTSAIEVGNPSGAVAELRRRSGFTWEQLSRLFGVSRRSMHFWASGKAMAPANEEHLQRVLGVIRRVDRGSPEATRAALVEVGRDGVAPFDLLIARQYERVVSSFAAPGEAIRTMPQRPSTEVLATRSPLPPGQLVDALQDRVHTERGAVRRAASVRARRVRGGA